MFFVIKGFMPLRIVGYIDLHMSCALVQKTLVDHVQPTLNECLSTICTFQHSPLTFECQKVHPMYSIVWCPIIGSLSMFAMNYLRQLIHLV
jgi:hypothetical protein